MKKLVIFFTLMITLLSQATDGRCFPVTKGASRTFMFTHPFALNQAARNATWHTAMYNIRNEETTGVQVRSVFQNSFSTKENAQYFLFGKKNSLFVAGDAALDAHQRDIRAEWLGINNPKFRGTLTIDPEQTQLGAILTYHVNFKTHTDLVLLEDSWLNFELSAGSVRNNLNLMQHDIHNRGSSNPRDIIESFKQPAWRYAKIRGGESRIGVGNLDIRIGKNYLTEGGFELVYYAGASIPFSSHQDAEFLFDPFLGNNGHFAIIAGINMNIVLNQYTASHTVAWFIDLEDVFLIRNSQSRTLDLIGRPWSRYLMLVKQGGSVDQCTPAVNVLSQSVRIRPYDMADFSTGIRFIGEQLEIEVGYGIWGHGSERVKLNCDFPPLFGIAGTGSVTTPSCTGTQGAPPLFHEMIAYQQCDANPPCPTLPSLETAPTASNSTIACQACNDVDSDGNPIFVPICESDLDLRSAEARHTINQKFHFAIGYTNWGRIVDGFIGAGAYYEFPQKNAALTIGGVWLKCGAAF